MTTRHKFHYNIQPVLAYIGSMKRANAGFLFMKVMFAMFWMAANGNLEIGLKLCLKFPIFTYMKANANKQMPYVTQPK